MSYQQKITRKTPALIVLLLDVSNSMNNMWGSSGKTLAEGASYAVNRTIRDILINACVPNTEIMNYVNLAVYAYGTGSDDKSVVWNLGSTSEPSEGFANAEDWAHAHHRMKEINLGVLADDSSLAKSEKLPIWVETQAIGWTPMCKALDKASEVVKNHISTVSEDWSGTDSFPPIVINITDGIPTDHGDDWNVFKKAASGITDQATSDGNALLFNIHLDSSGDSNRILFPDYSPDHSIYAKELAEVTSILPAEMARRGRNELGFDIPENAKGYCLNADFESLVAFLRIGTTVAVSDE